MQYHRAFVPGGQYFFTVVTESRQNFLTNDVTVDLLRQAFRQVMLKRPFTIDAAVILPDHLHCIWTLPTDDQDFSTRWRLIKTWFTKHYQLESSLKPNAARIKKQQQALWQHRFWEHVLRDEHDYENHVNYIHFNPVKHGYTSRPSEWRYSSFHRFVKQGILPWDWGGQRIEFDCDVGNE